MNLDITKEEACFLAATLGFFNPSLSNVDISRIQSKIINTFDVHEDDYFDMFDNFKFLVVDGNVDVSNTRYGLSFDSLELVYNDKW